MKRKILSAVLAALMLLSVVSLAACVQPSETGNETTAAPDVAETTGAPETTSKYDIGDALGTQNYGETISIVSRSNKWVADEIYVEESDGGLIVSAVERRNKVVEQRLGITIENTKVDGDNYAVSDLIRNQAQTGHVYDLFANSVYSTIMYTTENVFADLKAVDTIDLSQPYWSQGFNDSASIGDSQYFVTGAIALSTYRFIFATFFNTNMFNDKSDIPSLYETVRDHKWTVDYQMELSKMFWVDTDADQVTSEGDICGFISNANMLGVDPYWSAFKLPILTKDSDNYLVYSVDVERTTTAVEKMNQLFWSTEGAYSFKHETSDGEQTKIAKKFSEGTAAMATLRLIEVEDEYLRNMTDKYGIIPLPMLNADQDDYYSYAHDQMTALGMANTVTEDRREMLGAVLEAMASESYRYITPAYYEVALKSKYVSDPESWTMLDLVTDNLYIDAGVLYTKQINSVHQMFRTLVGNNSTGAATRFSSIRKATSSAVDKLNEALRDVVGK